MPVTFEEKVDVLGPLPVNDTSKTSVATTGPMITPAPSTVAPPSTLSPPETPPSMRHRSVSNVSTVSVADSTSSTASVVKANRQRDFEKLFGPQLRPRRLQDRPADFLTVVQTQSADLQASVLLHGRLYLTAYHLCFRSNIVGYVTEKIYPLGDILKVERSTTAKWIQNAVSLTVVNEDGDDEVVGYGSMKDRDAMYEELVELWKIRAPKRYEAFMKTEEFVRDDQEEHRASTSTIRPTAEETSGTSTTEETGKKSSPTVEGRSRAGSEVRHTESSGERYEQVALDTKIPIPMDELYGLLYHNKEFQMDFLENKQKLTDIKVSDWTEVDGKKERKMTYVMHMNNRIGPKKSDCIGTERIEKHDPDKSYEIVGETQTPDIPSGKSFKIRTRTCLSHTGLDNDETPATRLQCTTQCDWSASSMLKSTITPAVIKGQKEYHVQLLAAVKAWVKAHPDDFETQAPAAPTTGGGAGQEVEKVNGEKAAVSSSSNEKEGVQDDGAEVMIQKGTMENLSEIPGNSAMSLITILCALSLALNLFLLTRKC